MIVFLGLSFISLVLFTFINQSTNHFYTQKRWEDWLIDSSNLLIQGTLVPLIQTYILYRFYREIFPTLHQSLELPFILSFLINFILIDYLYYWNHRILHTKKLFPIHLVHHTAVNMDVFATSRNTLWTSFLIIYLWINAFFIFILQNPKGYIAALTLTAALDCWRHSKVFNPKYQSLLSRRLGFITPIDHSWHHSSMLNFNFGANLNIFDRLHKTYLYREDFPQSIGITSQLTLGQILFNPFGKKS